MRACARTSTSMPDAHAHDTEVGGGVSKVFGRQRMVVVEETGRQAGRQRSKMVMVLRVVACVLWW